MSSSARKLDLGFVSMGFPPDVGGVETHLGGLCEALQRRGHRIHVLCLDASEGLAPYGVRDLQAGALSIRRIAYRYHDHRALADLSRRRAANDALMAWMAERPTDVIHVMHPGGFAAATFEAIRDMGRPCVATLHDYWMLCPRGQMLRADGVLCETPVAATCASCLASTWPHLMPSTGGERRDVAGERELDDVEAAAARTRHALAMLALPDLLLTPSDAARAVFERSGLPKGRIRVIANACAESGLGAAVAARRRPREGSLRCIGVLGSVQPSKGVVEFARAALRRADDRLRIEIHGPLVDYHGDRRHLAALECLAASDPRLLLMGSYSRAQLADVLSRLDAVAVPSRWNEVFGLSAREARAAGLPVLAAARGGLLDLRDDAGVTWIEESDPDRWGPAIERWIDSLGVDASARALSSPARLRDAESLADELEAVYLDLVARLLDGAPPATNAAGESARSEPSSAAESGALSKFFRRLRGG